MFGGASNHARKVPWRLRGRLLFTSYRRRDTAFATGRIYDRLTDRFGKRRIIMDVHSIRAGEDFRDYVEHVLPHCRAVLAVIGPNWHIDPEADGRRYLEDPRDMVGFELACALRHGVKVVPVLIGTAQMPASDELPDALKRIPSLQAIPIRSDPDFDRDICRLMADL